MESFVQFFFPLVYYISYFRGHVQYLNTAIKITRSSLINKTNVIYNQSIYYIIEI